MFKASSFFVDKKTGYRFLVLLYEKASNNELRAEVVSVQKKNYKPIIYTFSAYVRDKVGDKYQEFIRSLDINTEKRTVVFDDLNFDGGGDDNDDLLDDDEFGLLDDL